MHGEEREPDGQRTAAGPPGEDAELVRRVLEGDRDAFEPLMRRHNQLLFRVARGIVPDDAEAEDVVQQTYASAYLRLSTFAGQAQLSSWLVRIAINEALTCLRKLERRSRTVREARLSSPWELRPDAEPSPEARVARGELRSLLEAAIDSLSDVQRLVFVLREVQGLSTAETAEALGTTESNVRVILHRVRRELRDSLGPSVDPDPGEAFSFAGERCDRIVSHVLARLSHLDALRAADVFS